MTPAARSRLNVVLLAVCQALAMMGLNIISITAALVGHTIADDKSLVTLPQALSFVGTLSMTIPASLLMGRIGRRAGFTIGASIGLVGALTATAAIYLASFPLFCVGIMLFGCYNGFAVFYRFAAADAAPESFRAKAISLVLGGGVLSATFGPELAKWSRDLLAPYSFAGCYLVIVGLATAAILLLQLVRIPRPSLPDLTGGRPIATIMRQPGFIAAALSGMAAYGAMSMVMTATPLAMLLCAHPFEDAAFVIQWHALAMYAPSFVTGHVIQRFGTARVMATGAALLTIAVAIDLAGISLGHFWIGLIVLGVGWNFLFVGASTLAARVPSPAERAKTQAANDFLVFGTAALSAFTSGALLDRLGWSWVNLAVLPIVVVALATILVHARRAPRPAAA